jgi:hypothetical protein
MCDPVTKVSRGVFQMPSSDWVLPSALRNPTSRITGKTGQIEQPVSEASGDKRDRSGSNTELVWVAVRAMGSVEE